MSKKFTSFLVVLAALLLTVPTQAQFAKKAAKQTTVLKAGPLKVNDVQKVKAAKAKANDKTVGLAFTGAMHQQVAAEATLLKAAINNIESDKVAFEKQMEANLRASLYGNQCQIGKVFGNVMLNQTRQNVFELANNHQNVLHRAAGEVVDENGVITAIPEGETKIYQRTGTGWYRSGSTLYYTEQAGNIEITETEDGTVYFKDFFSQVAAGTYIKGTKSGNTITVPAGQIVYYWASAGYGMRTGFAEYTTNGFVETKAGDPYILTIDGNTISLTETSFDFDTATGTIAALFYTDDDTFAGYGDNSSVFTYDPDWVAPELVELPEGATVETWYSTATAVQNSGNATVEGSAKVAFVGDDVYLSGIFSNYPDSWIKGTIDGTTVTFSGLQFLGTYSSFDIYAVGSNGYNSSAELQDFKMTYDATSKKFTSVNSLLANAKKDAVYFLEAYEGISITKDAPAEEVATTGANVDAVPYANALASAEDFADFGVIDSNKDGSTWSYDSSYGTVYKWNSSNAANDWLISPAIKLEAGKKYHFAIDAKAAGASFPEKFEVLLGTEAKASALTQSVLPEVTVTSTEFTTYENEEFSVAETGYYHFGIHATSDANQFRLAVANFLVEAGVEATAPAAVTDLAVAQTPEKLEAVVSFKAPTKTAAGEDLTDLTKIDVLRDGKVVKSVSGVSTINWVASAQGYEDSQNITAIDFGAGITAALAQNEANTHPRYWANDQTLRLYDKNTLTLTGNGIKKVVVTFVSSSNNKLTAVGFDVNGATGTWTGSANEIAFSATGKAFIKSIDIEYEAALTPGAEYSVVDAEGLTVGNHVYQVIPYNTSGVGVKSEEKSIFISVSLEAPYTFDFSQDLLDLFNVIDNNEDGKTWLWSSSNGAYYPYHGTNAADDYLITLPFNLKAGKRYNVIVNAKGSASYPERFEVKAGKEATVAGLTEQVIAPTDLNTGEFDDYEGVFAPEEDGLYYFAIHAISDPDMLNLQVKTLAIELAPELTAPAAVADLTATAGAEGALEATLAFTAPAKDIKGDALTGNVDVKIYRDNELVNTLEGIAAGAAASWKDTEVENGTTYTYYVVAANESGDGLKSEKVKVFVGEDAFGTVENIQITGSTASTISFSWDPVTGANGGYVNAAAAKYAIVSTHVETVLFWQVLVIDEILATVTGETSATVNYDVNAGDQGYKYFGVLAYKEDTELPAAGDEYAGGYTYALVGAPYELPMFESFTGKTMHYLWDSNAQLIVDEVSSDDDGVAVDLLADEAGIVTFESGKININGTANPTLLFNAKSPNISKLYVYASKNGGEMSPVAELDLTEDYQTFKVSLANLANNANYVQFALVAQYTTPYTVDDEGNLVDLGDYYTLDEIRVMDLFEYNLVADIKAPKSVVAGQKAKVVATVTNYGENAAKDYTVTVKAGENVLTTVIGSDELAPFAKDEIEVEYETSIFDEAGDVNLTVTVDYENELYPDDNTANTIITVKEPAAAAPENLTATDKGVDGVDLAWTVVAAGTEEVFENFTSYENGANEALGDWTLVNNNGASKGSIFNDLSLANDGLVKAWEVMKPSEYGIGNTLFNGPNGSLEEAYLISAYNLDGQSYPDNDDWLISPELPGIAQEISFAIGALDVQYGPSSYEVLVSSTDSEIASFTKVAEGTLTSAGWNSVTAQLPEGTKYFAIRNNTSGDGAMCVMLGDIKFTANSSATVASFNIYYNNEKIATVDGDKTTYTVAADKVEVGTQTFGVSAVYANGAESRVTTATIEIVTGIEQIAADGKPVDVYSIDGKLIRNQAKSLDGLKGLYIVNGKKIMVK